MHAVECVDRSFKTASKHGPINPLTTLIGADEYRADSPRTGLEPLAVCRLLDAARGLRTSEPLSLVYEDEDITVRKGEQ